MPLPEQLFLKKFKDPKEIQAAAKQLDILIQKARSREQDITKQAEDQLFLKPEGSDFNMTMVSMSRLKQSEDIFKEVIIQPRIQNYERKTSQQIQLQSQRRPVSALNQLDEHIDQQQHYDQDSKIGFTDVMRIVMKRFNMKPNQPGQISCFNQMIRVQLPDYLVNPRPQSASGTKISVFVRKQIAQDLIIKAKAGVQQGDFLKESQINFQMAQLAEEQNQLQLALSFYKRFYLCSRVLKNDVDATLALNRLGILYGQLSQFKVSLQYHQKHFESLNGYERFIAKYNLGIANRLSGSFHNARSEIEEALEIIQTRIDLESKSLCVGQLAIISFLEKNYQKAYEYFVQCLTIGKDINAGRMKLDCLLCLAYIAFDKQDWQEAKDYFNKAYFIAIQCSEINIAEKCICNVGIATGNLTQKPLQFQMRQTFYKNATLIKAFPLKDDSTNSEDE